MGPEWSPEVYGRHAGPRLRPALDLLGRIPIANAETVVDLGCGSGALFPALRARFATARLMGVDSSPAMLERARAVDPDVELVEADAAFWRPGSTVDLIVANASLQLISGHERLIPELLGCCRCLAVQVPDNFAAPSHRLVRETMAQAPWSDQLAGVRARRPHPQRGSLRGPVARRGAGARSLADDLLSSLGRPAPVLDWLRGTTLLPVQAALGGAGSPATIGVRGRAGRAPRRGLSRHGGRYGAVSLQQAVLRRDAP